MRHFVWESGVRKEVTREEAIEMDKVENEGRMKAIEELEKLVVRLDVYAVRHGDAHIEGITVELETILAALQSQSPSEGAAMIPRYAVEALFARYDSASPAHQVYEDEVANQLRAILDKYPAPAAEVKG